jgi:hypothetical protein
MGNWNTGLEGYLCGPMADASDQECNEWRDKITKALPEIHWRNPMVRDFREGAEGHETFIVEGDKRDIVESDFIVAYPWKPSAGTSMEILFAKDCVGIDVYTIYDRQRDGRGISPWITYHSDKVFNSIDEFIAFAKENLVPVAKKGRVSRFVVPAK